MVSAKVFPAAYAPQMSTWVQMRAPKTFQNAKVLKGTRIIPESGFMSPRTTGMKRPRTMARPRPYLVMYFSADLILPGSKNFEFGRLKILMP